MAINTIKATIQMRHGNEEDFDPDKMTVGEWAVSTDSRYIRMCISPGVCVRIALYNAFEGDMEEIQKILEECRTIEETVEAIQAQIGQEVEVIATLKESAQNAANTASQKATEAAKSATNASASASTATQKANAAKASADAASASSTQAGTYSQNAEGSAQNALEYSNTASTKAEEAAQSATSASGYANNASISATNAGNSALEAESYTHGDTNVREGEDTDNALYYKEQAKNEADRAKNEADRASDIVGIGIATTEKAGIVKPDGETITIDPDGTLHSQGGGITPGTVDYNELENKPSIGGMTLQGNKTLSDLGIQPKGDYAPIESPVFTGAPKAPTPPDNENSTRIATTAYVKKLISNLINGAPETLDTLKEIADALGENDDTVQALNAAIGNKVDKVVGKGLSTNDFTTDEKNKLNGIANNANNYSLPLASAAVRGGVKVGYTENGKNYPVELSNEQMFVKVPWTDNDTWKANTASSEGYVSAGNGHADQVWKTDANGIPGWRADANTTYGAATQSANGLMSAADKKKLDGIAEGANKTTLTTSLAVTQSGVSGLDGTVGKILKDDIDKINSNLASGQIEFKIEDGKGYWRAAGADTWNPFSNDVTHVVSASASVIIWNSARTLRAELNVDGKKVSSKDLNISSYVEVGDNGTGKQPSISTNNVSV